MKFQMYVDVVVRDKNGKVIQRIRKRKCTSYVRAMMDLLRAQFGQTSTTAVDTGGASRTFAGNTYHFWATAGASVTTFGIRVGTGTAAVTIADYSLQTPIAEGTGAGQLTHGATSVSTSSTVGSSRLFTVARTFTNNSGTSITVNEVGLIVTAQDTGVVDRNLLVERSLLTFSIANGASATVTYTIQVTV